MTNVVSERLLEAWHVGKYIVQQRDVGYDGFLIRFNNINICQHHQTVYTQPPNNLHQHFL